MNLNERFSLGNSKLTSSRKELSVVLPGHSLRKAHGISGMSFLLSAMDYPRGVCFLFETS